MLSNLRPELERRSSTGRILLTDAHAGLWQCTNNYATQVCPCETFCSQPSSVSNYETPRPCFIRRHSTGSMYVQEDEDNKSLENFWQTYEPNDNVTSTALAGQTFARRRTVRFAKHVTVWVFPHQNFEAAGFSLPQTFVKKTHTQDSSPLAAEKRKQSGEDRFRPNAKGKSPPSFPSRRQGPIVDPPPSPPQRRRSNDGFQQECEVLRMPSLPRKMIPSNENSTNDISEVLDTCTSAWSCFSHFNHGSCSERCQIEYDSDDSTIVDPECDESVTDNKCDCGSRSFHFEKLSLTDTHKTDQRSRVLMWYHRWAMPSYAMMRHHVQSTPGLDITVEDVDLLPWSTIAPPIDSFSENELS